MWGCRRPWPWWFGNRFEQPEVVLDSEAPIGPDGTIKNVFIGFGEESGKQIDDAVNAALKEAKPAA